MTFFQSLGGWYRVRLVSVDPVGALREISGHGLCLERIRWIDPLSLEFLLRRQELAALRALAEKRGNSVAVCEKIGLYWRFFRWLHRPALLGCGMLLLMLTLFLPTRVLFIEVEGNKIVPTRQILATAEQYGVRFGASRQAVRSEVVKNGLLAAMPQLQWAGVNTRGCVAVISVQEKKTEETTAPAPVLSRIVAERDGVITSYTVEQGRALCRVGQVVQKGDVLVSGYSDCGIAIRATRAAGEVYAKTSRDLTAITPVKYIRQERKRTVEKKYALLVGKKRINFYQDSGILGGTCDKMSETVFLTLPGGYVLPVALITEVWVRYDCVEWEQPDEESGNLLRRFAETYLREQMVAGQILQMRQNVNRLGEGNCLTGRYACLEMIGREQNEETEQIWRKQQNGQ